MSHSYLVTVRSTVVVRLKLPDVPVMVIVFPSTAFAELLTATVNVLVEVAGLGLNDAVTPCGSPLALRVTFWSKVLVGVMVTVVYPPVPGVMIRAFGKTDSVKFGCNVVSLIVVARTKLPDVPAIVIVAAPIAAESLTFSVNVLLEVAGLGLNVAVTPTGNLLALRVTFPSKPSSELMAIMPVPLLP